ncbi:MAG: hypothetical protein CL566_09480 [Alphaproteobacteria bacterium]|nr:hypothetical protein [Alphaproteobacteria bacterium]|tara:strand:- start:1123 stop:1317 length:195 start_codon:yes stop_codon:yes gene_type:complete
MFGFSLTKLLVLAVIVGAVVIGFRLFNRSANGASGDGRRSETYDTEYDVESDSYVVREDKSKDG